MDLSKDLSEFIKSYNVECLDNPAFAGKIADLAVNFTAREQYIRNKRAVGRPQDLADLEALS
jgi:hypothetical protein